MQLPELIRRRYGIRLSKASVCRLLNRFGLTAQRPVWHAYWQRPEDARRWLEDEYAYIRTLGEKLNVVMFFTNEAAVRTDRDAGRARAPRGRTQEASSTGVRFGSSLLSAVSARGEPRFIVARGRATARVFVDFLRRLSHNAGRALFVIVDGLPAHSARMAVRFVALLEGQPCLFFLAPCSPTLDPDEGV